MSEASTLPILYSFRRCPYAIRARLALAQAGVTVELREILLRDKPAAMLALSAKGTVPVLQLPDGTVFDESLDIMRWALAQQDPDDWQRDAIADDLTDLIAANDGPFKHWLDRYKYFERHPDHPREHYRAQAENILQTWEARLVRHAGQLSAGGASLADYALLPFVRQFAHSDDAWWSASPYPRLQQWLQQFEQSALFQRVMPKWPVWPGNGTGIIVEWRQNATS